MRSLILALSLLMLSPGAPRADVNVSVGVGIALPGVRIGVRVPAYPRLVRVPNHPVYYDPQLEVNLFFYDGLYWVFVDDDWYVSDWYDGPWRLVARFDVPVYLLRVPVRYYRRPPPYFHGWVVDRPPRWDEHWGPDWNERRRGWDISTHRLPPPAPLPYYQRHYSGEYYPRGPEESHVIRREHYRYQPRDPVARQHYQPPRDPRDQRDQRGPQDRGHGERR
ncbi:MAG: hypothetical protein AB1593_08880 [Pseudomonadota bacterium]